MGCSIHIQFIKIGEKYITALYGGKKQNAEISWETVLNKMVQNNAFTEEEADND